MWQSEKLQPGFNPHNHLLLIGHPNDASYLQRRVSVRWDLHHIIFDVN